MNNTRDDLITVMQMLESYKNYIYGSGRVKRDSEADFRLQDIEKRLHNTIVNLDPADRTKPEQTARDSTPIYYPTGRVKINENVTSEAQPSEHAPHFTQPREAAGAVNQIDAIRELISIRDALSKIDVILDFRIYSYVTTPES